MDDGGSKARAEMLLRELCGHKLTIVRPGYVYGPHNSLARETFGWDVSLNGSTNTNELVSLGGVPPITGTTQEQREGYPLNGYWSNRLVDFADKNGNGIIEYNADPAVSEITVSAGKEYHGTNMPRYEFALTNGFDF